MAQLFLFIALLFTPDSDLFSGPYALSDLEVLANEGSYEEFFKHALDIRPTERQETWKAMTVKMADHLTKAILQKSKIEPLDFKKVEALYLWPALKNDDVFRTRRQEIGLRYIKSCLKSTPPCNEALRAFWEVDTSDSDLAFKLAELVQTVPEIKISPWTFLDVALKGPLSEFYCKKEFVIDTLWNKLDIDYVHLGLKGDLLVKIDHTIHPDCLPYLIKEAKLRLISPKKLSDRELAFQILHAQSKADQKTTDIFYTIYLLESPGQGDLFNYSWNRLKELKNSFERRENVLSQLKSMDPLPDEIMGSMDQVKKRVVLTHLKENFPEYLEYYTDQCINYYKGQGHFPRGNPTVNCQNFMNSELAPKLLDNFKLKRYEEAKKI